MSKPLALDAVMAAAAPLLPCDRDAVLRSLANILSGEHEIGDGSLHRAIRSVQRQFFRPPVMVEVRHNSKLGAPIP
jgi:hypothetical protein